MKIGNLYYKNDKILEMFAIESYNYRGETKYRVLCHQRSDTGLIHKTVTFRINENNLKNYKLLDWKF